MERGLCSIGISSAKCYKAQRDLSSSKADSITQRILHMFIKTQVES